MTTQPTALVTGAAQGLGLSISAALLAAGYAVATADRNESVLAASSAALASAAPAPDRVLPLTVDVTSASSVSEAVASAAAWAGRLDVLVNCAGVISRLPSEELLADQWQQTLDVNLGGAIRCAAAVFPYLQQSANPSVLNIGSIGSFLGMPKRLAYNTSKTGILGITQTLAAEWGPHGIRVNAIAPGFIETEMMRSGLDSGALDEALMTRRIPLRRLGNPDEIAGVAVFLASAQASYINGVTLPVDGGVVIDGTFF